MNQINDALKRPTAKTKGYAPIQTWWLRRHQKLPPLTFQIIEQMLLDETIQIGLAARRAIVQGVEFGYEVNGQWQVGVMCQDEAVGAWVMRQIRKLWDCAIEHLASAQIYGWAGCEVIWERSDEFGTWEISTIEQRHANDVRMLLDPDTGRSCGIRFQRVKGAPEGYLDLRHPECLFHSYNAFPGEHYGTTVLQGSYRAWADKHLDGGAVDVRRLFMHKDAYGGADLRYPEGSTDIGTVDNPHEVANRELAREIVEQIEAGGVTTTPAQYDDKGNPMWNLTRATVPANPSHILQYPGDLDGEMLRGMFVPDGVLKADDAGSWQGRLIPMGILYANLDPWVRTIINDMREQLLEPGIINNFGRMIPFDVKHKPLAKQALEAQRQPQAMGMDPGMGGMDGGMGMDPGMDPMGGMDDGGDDPNAGPDPNGPSMMGVKFDAVQAVGEGVLSAANVVKAAMIALGESDPQLMAAMRAPKGYTKDKPLVIAGNEYHGGMFVPSDVVEKATPEQRRELESGEKATDEEEPKSDPKPLPVKAPSLREKSKFHDKWSMTLQAGHKLTLKSGHKAQIISQRKGGKLFYTVRHYDPSRKRTDYDRTFTHIADAADFASMVLHHHSSQTAPKATKPAQTSAAPKPKRGSLNERNYSYKSTKFFSSGVKSKFKDNLEALRTLKLIEDEDREATPEEKEKISKFVGWGQMPGLFNDYHERLYYDRDDLSEELRRIATNSKEQDKWDKERKELKTLLGQDGYEAARASVINGHYTHPEVVKKQWEMAKRLGFTGGKMLEPAVGGGYYLGFMPEDVKSNTAITAVEMDPGSATIAKALYPDANVVVSPFEQYKTPDNYFDLVATNVPFDESQIIRDSKLGNLRPNLHDYYFLRSAQTTKPGGLAMLITSAGTMDKISPDVRKAIDADMEFVSAVRFPGTMHKENAGTEVVTDLVILRKKGAVPEDTPDEVPPEALPSYGIAKRRIVGVQKSVEGIYDKHGGGGESNRDRKKIDEEVKKSIREASDAGLDEAAHFTGITVDSLGRLYHWKDGKRVPAPRWDDTVEVPDPLGGDPIRVNRYFAEHPEQILGTLDRSGTMYTGGMKNVQATDDFETLFQDAIDRLPENIVRTSQASVRGPSIPDEPERILTATKHNEGETVIHEGGLYTYVNGALEPHRFKNEKKQVLMSMIGIRDKVRELVAAERAGKDGAAIRSELNAMYDSFRDKYGLLHDHAAELKGDLDRPMIMSLESYDKKSKEFRKADVFEKSTARRATKVSEAKTIEDAVGVSMHDAASIDVARISSLLGKTVEDVEQELTKKGLAYLNPNGDKWESRDEYLSGNTREKLAQAIEVAKTDDRYLPNVEALRAAQPEDVPIQDISVRMGSPWVHHEVYEAFVASAVGINRYGSSGIKFRYSDSAASWLMELPSSVNSGRAAEAWSIYDSEGDLRVKFSEIVEAAMTQRAINVWEYDGDTKFLNRELTDAAQSKVEELQERFNEWALSLPQVSQFLEKSYNEKNNNIKERTFDGSHQTFPGMDEKYAARLYDIQKNFVWRVVTTGVGLAAHEVGTGKTTSMVAAAMECRRLGLAKKPAFAVLKSTIEQFTREAQELYPEARILSLSDMFDKESRRETLHRIATGDYDMIIMTHENLEGMRLRPESEQAFIQEEVADLESAIIDAHAEKAAAKGKSDSKIGDKIVKELEKRKNKLLERLQKSQNPDDKDPIFFEDSGIDMLFVDEAHKFKSLPANTSRNYAGISKQEANRAMDMLFKCRWLQKNNNGRGVVFATGTPISNSMTELFNMQRYLQYDELKKRGLHKFDAWADTFGVLTNDLEFKPSGDIARKQRFAKFVNVPELRLLASQFMDVQMADNLRKPDGSPVVKRPRKHIRLIVSEETDRVKEMQAEIAARAAAIKGQRKFEKGEDNPLKIMGDAKMGSMDPRLVHKDVEDDPQSKANKALAEVIRMYHEHPGTVQAVFSDLGVHAKENRISLFDDMRSKLIAQGIPANEIAVLSDPDMKDAEKDRIATKLRTGDVRIAFGSTQTLGTGMNIQDKLKAVHHLDIPYNPAAIEQRNGRAYRSGNTNEDIDEFRYTTLGSSDPMFWQINARKTNFKDQFMLGKAGREMEDLRSDEMTPEQLVAISTGDPRRLERIEVDQQYNKLKRAKSRHATDVARMRTLLEKADSRQERLVQDIQEHAEDLAMLNSQGDFVYEAPYLRGYNESQWTAPKPWEKTTSIKERKKAEESLKAAIEHYNGEGENKTYYSGYDRSKGLPIAKIKGFEVKILDDGRVSVQGPSGRVQFAQPSLQSIEAAIKKVKKRHEEAVEALKQHESEIEHFKREVEKPFQLQGKLDSVRKRLIELREALGETVRPEE